MKDVTKHDLHVLCQARGNERTLRRSRAKARYFAMLGKSLRRPARAAVGFESARKLRKLARAICKLDAMVDNEERSRSRKGSMPDPNYLMPVQ